MKDKLLNFVADKYNIDLIAEQIELEAAPAAALVLPICKALNVSYAAIMSERKTADLAHVRLCIVYTLVKQGYTLLQSIRAVNRLNHTTARYARDRVYELLELGDKKTISVLNTINEVLETRNLKQI